MSNIISIPFVWERGSLNDNGIELLKEHGLEFCYRMMKLCVRLNDRWCPVEYKKRDYNDQSSKEWLLEVVDWLSVAESAGL